MQDIAIFSPQLCAKSLDISPFEDSGSWIKALFLVPRWLSLALFAWFLTLAVVEHVDRACPSTVESTSTPLSPVCGRLTAVSPIDGI